MKLSLLMSFVGLPLLTHAQTFVTNNGIQIVNSASITVNGSWANDANTQIKNDGSITTSENWINNGILNTASEGKFILNYATDHNFVLGGNAIGSLIKKGTGNALISGSIHIKDTLLLSGGVLKLNGTDTLLLQSGTILSVSTDSYVEGKVAHQGNGTKLYPVGRDGIYLPVTIHKMQALKATASVNLAPLGYTKGGGVEALIDFPYAWTVDEQTASDTAAYIELSYPNSLPGVSDPIVVRSIPGAIYASMGARLTDETGGRVTIKSYSRGLKGLYSVASGFPSDFKTDSLALVSVYHSTNGTGWKTKTNWLSGNVSEWSGVTMTGQSITALDLSNNNLSGPIEDFLVDILSLQNVNISGNQITAIPAFVENPEIKLLDVSGNKLEFGALEANAGLLIPEITFNYANQADLGEPSETLVDVGGSHQFEAPTNGAENIYQWVRNGVDVKNATAKTFTITSIGRENMGEYVCVINNNLFPGLTLKTVKQKALAVAKLSGKLFANDEDAASKGIMTLFKINATGKYDTTAVKDIGSDGSYLFEKIVLDDYQLLGYADTIAYNNALPTYYAIPNTIYWEEASAIAVNSNLSDLNVISQYLPSDGDKGNGVISGTFEEETNEAGKIEAAKRVSGAGASVRRVEGAARPMAEKLTLVTYVFTNENGEFVMPELPKGNYRLNIQYPGYPMDETSFIDMTIGDGLQSQVGVAAKVEKDKIVVRKLVVTALSESTKLNIDVFPNPSADFVTIRFPDESATRMVQLISISGAIVASAEAAGKINQVNVRQYPFGIYLLNIKDKGQIIKTVRIVVN